MPKSRRMVGRASHSRHVFPRGAAAGLGSAGSLAAAVVCAFLLVSATVAFRDWPGSNVGDPGRGSVTVAGPEPAVTASEVGPSPDAAAQAAPVPATAGAPARRIRSSPGAPSGGERSGSVGEVRAGRPPAPATTAPPVQSATAATPAPAPPRPLRDTVAGAGAQVRTTGRAVGSEVSRVDEPTGRQVTAITDTLATAIEDVAELLP